MKYRLVVGIVLLFSIWIVCFSAKQINENFYGRIPLEKETNKLVEKRVEKRMGRIGKKGHHEVRRSVKPDKHKPLRKQEENKHQFKLGKIEGKHGRVMKRQIKLTMGDPREEEEEDVVHHIAEKELGTKWVEKTAKIGKMKENLRKGIRNTAPIRNVEETFSDFEEDA